MKVKIIGNAGLHFLGAQVEAGFGRLMKNSDGTLISKPAL